MIQIGDRESYVLYRTRYSSRLRAGFMLSRLATSRDAGECTIRRENPAQIGMVRQSENKVQLMISFAIVPCLINKPAELSLCGFTRLKARGCAKGLFMSTLPLLHQI